MNIFVTNLCPTESAKVLDDKRVIKMILESAQMLCTAINLFGTIKSPYKSTHRNHPDTVWARASHENYIWLCKHFTALCDEYKTRFNKVHKCEQYKDFFYDCSTVISFPEQGLTAFPNCTTFKEVKETTLAYRNYLNQKWQLDKRPPKWTNSLPPNWKVS